MSMKGRKSLFMLNVLIIVTLVLSACSSGSSAPKSTTSTKESSSSGQSSQSAQEPLVFTGMANLYGNAPAKDSEFWKTLEEKFNVDYTVNWSPADNYQENLDLVLASGDIPDVMQITNTTAPANLRAAKSGAFWDLTDYLGDFSNYPNLGATNPEAWILSKVEGRNYFIPRTRGNLDSAMFIRQDWLDELNLDVPTTIDEFADAVKAIAQNKPDVIGMIPNPGYFLAAFGARDPIYDDDGGIIHMNLTPNYAEYVEYMRDLFEAGAIAEEFALISGTQQEEMFMTGRMATFVKNAWHKYRMEQETAKTDPNAAVTLLPYLEGPKGHAHILDLGYFGGMAISSNVEEEKMLRLLEFFDATAAEEHYNFVNFGIEGVHYELVDGFPSLTEQGLLEVNASFNAPFIFATDEFAKVDSPLAPMSYNLETRKEMEALYEIEGKVDIFRVLQSDTWTVEWSKIQDEFDSMSARAISGAISVDEFRAYQENLVQNPEMKQAFQEFAQSYEEFFGSK